jgi:hypothetical protein
LIIIPSIFQISPIRHSSLAVKITIMKLILAAHYELAGSSFLEVTVRNAARIKLG